MLTSAFTSNNLLFRNINPKKDSLDAYHTWMKDTVNNRFILGVDKEYKLIDLILYINNKNASPNALLLGIYDRLGGLHIGNIKFEPIVNAEKSAWIGIIIGDMKYRNKGLAKSILITSCKVLSGRLNIHNFWLGVSPDNLSAIGAYENCGFQYISESVEGGKLMLLQSDSFKDSLP